MRVFVVCVAVLCGLNMLGLHHFLKVDRYPRHIHRRMDQRGMWINAGMILLCLYLLR